MQSILNFISQNPILFTIVFTLTNILWFIFSFYQKQKNDKALIDHKANKDKELETIKHNFELDLEKKKKSFGIKQKVYDEFFEKLDKFQSKANIDTQQMLNQYLQNYLTESIKANELNDTDALAKATGQYHVNIQRMFEHLSKELNTLNHECNRLKFVAPIEIRTKLKEITAEYDEIFKITLKYINNISNLFFEESEQNQITLQFNADIQPISDKLKSDMEAIENLLRSDLFS